jgi:hypothetical protein
VGEIPCAEEEGVSCWWWVLGYEEPDDRCVRICPASASDVWSIASEMELTVFV